MILFFVTAFDYNYFPNGEEDLIYGEYRVGYIGSQSRSGGVQLNAFDRDGNGLIFELYNAGLGTQAYSMLESISGKKEYVTIGWYSGCLFGRVNLDWPCPVEVVIKKNEKVYLSYDKSKSRFENRTELFRIFLTYGLLALALIFAVYEFFKSK